MRPTFVLPGVLVCVFGIVACGGGGGRTAAPLVPAARPTPSSGPLGSVALTLTRSTTPSSVRRLTYVSSATSSVTVTASNGGSTVVTTVNLATVCPSFASTGICSLTAAAPIGTDTIGLVARDASSNVLSVANATGIVVTADAASVLTPVALLAVPATMTSVATGAPYHSSTGTPITFIVKDAQGGTESGAFGDTSGTPVSLTANAYNSVNATTFSTSSSCGGATVPLTVAAWTSTQTLYVCNSSGVGGRYAFSIGSASTYGIVYSTSIDDEHDRRRAQ